MVFNIIFYILSMNKKQNQQIQQPSSKPEYYFTNNTFHFGVRESLIQNEENYNQMYQALSEGVYESSDAYQVDDNHEQQQQNHNIPATLIHTSEHQQAQRQIENVKPSQNMEDHLNRPYQSQKQRKQLNIPVKAEQRCSKPDQKVFSQHEQKKNDQDIQKGANLSQSQEQEFYFAESMSHYESVMQLQSSNFMKTQSNTNSPNDKLEKIQQQKEINEQTNKILMNSFPKYQPINQKQDMNAEQRQKMAIIQIKSQEKMPLKQHLEQLQSKNLNNRSQFQWMKTQLTKFSKLKQKGKTTINIHGYDKQYFLKMETQIYQIEVCKEDKNYFIKRRFADFATLEQLVRLQYAGYILYPFPQKSLEAFKKINFSMGTQQEKIVLSEKRLLQLEKYVNFLFRHEQISHSFLLQVFIQEKHEEFQKEISNIYSITQSQENDLQRSLADKGFSNIKKIVRTNFSFLKGYFAPQDLEGKQKIQMLKSRCHKNKEKIVQIQSKHTDYCNKLETFLAKMQKLAKIYKENSQIPNLQSNIDSILSFGTKLSSSRTFYNKILELMSDHILIEGRYYESILKNIESMLKFRLELLGKVSCLQAHHYSIGVRLQEKIKLFEDRFIEDFSNFGQQFENNVDILQLTYWKCWRHHCKLLLKIWK